MPLDKKTRGAGGVCSRAACSKKKPRDFNTIVPLDGTSATSSSYVAPKGSTKKHGSKGNTYTLSPITESRPAQTVRRRDSPFPQIQNYFNFARLLPEKLQAMNAEYTGSQSRYAMLKTRLSTTRPPEVMTTSIISGLQNLNTRRKLKSSIMTYLSNFVTKGKELQIQFPNYSTQIGQLYRDYENMLGDWQKYDDADFKDFGRLKRLVRTQTLTPSPPTIQMSIKTAKSSNLSKKP